MKWLSLFALLLTGCGKSPQPHTKSVSTSPARKQSLPQRVDAPQIRSKLKTMGSGLYIYTKWDRAASIAQTAKALRCGHVLPRYAGLKRTMTGNRPLGTFTDAMEKEGLRVMPWIYYYPSTGKQFLREIYTGIGSKPNFAGVMINIENPISADQVRELKSTLTSLRDRYAPGTLIGYTGYNLPITHGYIPVLDLLRMADFWSPQVYWGHNGSKPSEFLGRGYAQWYKVGESLKFDPIIVPVGQTYYSDRTIQKYPEKGEYARFVEHTRGYDAIAWYAFHEVEKRKAVVEEIQRASDKYRPLPRFTKEPAIVQQGSLGWYVAIIVAVLVLPAILFWLHVTRRLRIIR